MQVAVHSSIAEIAAADWNRLAGPAFPFLQHEFLAAAESSGSVAPEHGWQPRHLALMDGDSVRAAMPLYEKSHSWGEFVFDWAWANAYDQAGLPYYPKLVSASPFTPAPGPRLLCAEGDDEGARLLLAAAVTLAGELECSSLHVQFPAASEVKLLEDAGMLIRRDCQFHWHNRNYADFDEFLGTFTSAKRKKVKRERRRVTESGISFRRLPGTDMDDATWTNVYTLISRTFMARGSLPYFKRSFFVEISKTLPENLLVILAELEGVPVAAAVFYVGAERLYGRYWGSDGHFDSLHFETCYYQGIDYCIDHGVKVFEPGTQGEHKIARGFVPVETWSAHWLAHPEFSDAIERYLGEESRHVSRYMAAVDRHTPYRDDE